MRIELNHWFVNKNILSASFMNFYVEIYIMKDFKCKLVIYDSQLNKLELIYNNLEEAINYAENNLEKNYFKSLEMIK